MAHQSTGAIHDGPAITTTGNREERDAQVDRIRARYERLHPGDAVVDRAGQCADAHPDSPPRPKDECP